MSDSFDGDHGVDARSTGKIGAVHHEKIAHFPGFAIGVGGRSFGGTAEAGGAHDVEREKREPSRIPAREIQGLRERIERAAAARLVGAPFCVGRKNMACAGCFKDARCGDKSLAQVRTVEWRKSVVRDRMAFSIGGYAAAVPVAEKYA